ncbi:unnamed protein product, partial [Owenia fusiformis]
MNILSPNRMTMSQQTQ